jgi:Arc/MetJ family transcription regulator
MHKSGTEHNATGEFSPRSIDSPNLTAVMVKTKLIEDVMRVTGAKGMREVVELGLQTLVRLASQEQLRQMGGTVDWEGDLDAMRVDR